MRAARALLLLPVLLVTACITVPGSQTLRIETRSAGQVLDGATCLVTLGREGYTVTTPATLAVGNVRGDLQVSCSKPGYRTSELYLRGTGGAGNPNVGIGASGGSGGHVGLGLGLSFPLQSAAPVYPPVVVLDMQPL